MARKPRLEYVGAIYHVMSRWNLDAKALLLHADMDLAHIDPQAVNYNQDKLRSLSRQVRADLEILS
jgi:hypothetical protein